MQAIGANAMQIDGSNLNATYSVTGFHYHWGWSDHQGMLLFLESYFKSNKKLTHSPC